MEQHGHMPRRRWRAPALGVTTALAVAAASILVPRALRAADAPPPQRLIVTLSALGDGARAFLGVPKTVGVRALGASPIAALELWVDGTRIEVTAPPVPGPLAVARWEWAPGEKGDHLLISRALDQAGRVSYSNVLRLEVLDRPPVVAVRKVRAQAGETIRDIAGRTGIAPADIAYWNPRLPARRTLRKGRTVAVPFPVAIPAASPKAPLLDARPVAAATKGLAPPEISAAAKDCSVELQIADNATAEDGFAVYQIPPSGTSLVPIATLAANGGAGTMPFKAAAAAGVNAFVVASYDDKMLASSNIVTVDVTDECVPGWTGDARLQDGMLITEKGADAAWFYLRLDEGGWQRVPPAGAIPGSEGGFDAAPSLPQLEGKRIELEAWGDAGGALVSLGEGIYVPKETDLPGVGAVVGHKGFASLRVIKRVVANTGSTPAGDYEIEGTGEFPTALIPVTEDTIAWTQQQLDSIEREFRWDAPPHTTSIKWQITGYPLQSLVLDPPGLLRWGIETGPKGKFVVNLTSLIKGTTTSPASETLLEEFADTIDPSNVSTKLPPNDIVGNEPVDANADLGPGVVAEIAGGAVPTKSVTLNLAALGPIAQPGVFYVRAIPFVGMQPLGITSNIVRLDLEEEPEPFTLPDTTPKTPREWGADVVFHEPRRPNGFYAKCLMIVGHSGKPNIKVKEDRFGLATPNSLEVALTDASKDVKYPYQAHTFGVQIGDTLCPQPPKKKDSGFSLAKAFDAFVSFVSDMIDTLASAAAWLKDQIVTGLVKITACEQLASSSMCDTLATIVVDAALTSMGIPPNIPNFSQLVALGKGELAELAVSLADQVPGKPCQVLPEECKDAAEEMIDKLIKEFDTFRTKSVAQSTGVWVPSGLNATREPRGVLRPPRFEITLKPQLPLSLPPDKIDECNTIVGFASMEATTPKIGYTQWSKSAEGGPWYAVQESKKGIFTASPFYGEFFRFDRTNPQQYPTQEVWLTREKPFWPGGNPNDFGGQVAVDSTGMQQVLVHPGNAIHSEVSGICVQDVAKSSSISPLVPA